MKPDHAIVNSSAMSGFQKREVDLAGQASLPTHAINAAPPIAAAVPASETAPEVPAGTDLNVESSLGLAGARAPISVAHVSALTAANAARKYRSELRVSGDTANRIAGNAGIPPFASTCTASRFDPLA